METGFQISVELTQLFPVRTAVEYLARCSVERVLGFARELKNSNSDILVEADLVAVFGRVWVDEKIARQFKSDVIKNRARIIIPDTPLELSIGAGPTLEYGFSKDADRGALSTIIQLSLLSSTHDRSTLASSLSYGFNKRVELAVPSANPSPGYDGIMGTLEAISSQSPGYFWSTYIKTIRERITPILGHGRVNNDARALPSNLLFACLDNLCMVQRLPEEYTLIVSDASGCVTLILWAHFVLGLPVVLRGQHPEDEVHFRHDQTSSPSVIIQGNRVPSMSGPEICLLGKENRVYLRIDPKLAEFVPIEARERVALAGYSVIQLCRRFGMSWSKTQEFEDAAHFSVAIAMSISRRLVRDNTDMPFSIKSWQIWDAASVLLKGVDFEEARAEKYAEIIPSDTPLKRLSMDLVPTCLRNLCNRMNETSLTPLCLVAIDLVAMATVPGTKECEKVPFIVENDFTEQGTLQDKMISVKGSISLTSTATFNHIARHLLGPSQAHGHLAVEEDSDDVFVVSDFGWTIYLPTFGGGHCDPSSINPEHVFLREGVPTENKTGERKSCIRDATAPSIEFVAARSIGPDARNAIIDNRVHAYMPRCVSPVKDRLELYGSRTNCFHVMLKFLGVRSRSW